MPLVFIFCIFWLLMAAYMCKALMFVVLFASSFTVSAQHATDTFHIYFDLNVPELNSAAKARIDALVYNDRIIPGSNILIVGYADYLGTEKANKKLSDARAYNVRDYLVTYNINKSDIKLCIGKGQVNRNQKDAEGYPADRKVDIVVERSGRTATKKTTVSTPPTSVKKIAGPPPAKNYKNNITDLAIYTPGETYVLKNIYFLPERHVITPQSTAELEQLYDVLESHSTLKIKIEGHVCCIRDYADALDIDVGDMNLSVNRARAIYDYLVNKGIDSSRLKYAGYGRSRPIVVREETEEDANKNRRVEIRVLSQ